MTTWSIPCRKPCSRSRTDYSPSGFLSVTHTFRKGESGRWQKHWLLKAEDMQGTYHAFQYPIERITGTADIEYDNDMQPLVKLDLAGYSRERPITLKGVGASGQEQQLRGHRHRGREYAARRQTVQGAAGSEPAAYG